jgi:hypothetical protein
VRWGYRRRTVNHVLMSSRGNHHQGEHYRGCNYQGQRAKNKRTPLDSHPKPLMTIAAPKNFAPDQRQNQPIQKRPSAACNIVRLATRALHF